MNQNTQPAWNATPGDILLLSGNSKYRPLNLGYQSIARGSRALYTHVALVISPFRVIHAVPGEGVVIKAWREIRDLYDPHESSVARIKLLDQVMRDKLISQAHYYFGQSYRILSLGESSEVFSDQKGIVCSQFVAKVFQDADLNCTSGGARKCLPLDIHSHTNENLGWLRIGLSDYLFDPPRPHVHNTLDVSEDFSFEMDGYAADMVKELYFISQVKQTLESTLDSFFTAAERAWHETADIPESLNMADYMLSPSDWTTAWTQHFATPKSPPMFLHEDREHTNYIRTKFISECTTIGTVGLTAFGYMKEIPLMLEGVIAKMDQGTSLEDQSKELMEHLNFLNTTLQKFTSSMDRILGWKDNMKDIIAPNPSGLLASGIFSCAEEISVASQCLANIYDFALARNCWNKTRPVILSYSEDVTSVLGKAMTGESIDLPRKTFSSNI